jgi:hypothetical protein
MNIALHRNSLIGSETGKIKVEESEDRPVFQEKFLSSYEDMQKSYLTNQTEPAGQNSIGTL